MPIAIRQLSPINAAQPGYAIAKELARQQVAQFGAVRGAGAGIGAASCCAALAVQPNPNAGFPAARALTGFAPAAHGAVPQPLWGLAALPYAVVYGNSQMAAGGLVAWPVGGHAERAAIINADREGLQLYWFDQGQAVLFVELHPCAGCEIWLNGIVNAAGAVTLNVWYRWAYPAPNPLPAGMLDPAGGPAAMNLFHGEALAAALANVNGPTW